MRTKSGKVVWRHTHQRKSSGRSSIRPHTTRKSRVAIAITATVVSAGGISVGAEVSASSSPSVHASSPKDGTDVKQPSTTVTIADAQTDLKSAQASLLIYWSKITGAIQTDNSCTAHSYDKVEKFFETNPCKWVFRAYLALFSGSSTQGPGMLIALSWVDMPNASLAMQYKKLVDEDGTGNITELSHDMGSYKNVNYSAKYYQSGIDNTAVWNVQVQPVSPMPVSAIQTALSDSRP